MVSTRTRALAQVEMLPPVLLYCPTVCLPPHHRPPSTPWPSSVCLSLLQTDLLVHAWPTNVCVFLRLHTRLLYGPLHATSYIWSPLHLLFPILILNDLNIYCLNNHRSLPIQSNCSQSYPPHFSLTVYPACFWLSVCLPLFYRSPLSTSTNLYSTTLPTHPPLCCPLQFYRRQQQLQLKGMLSCWWIGGQNNSTKLC